MDDDSQAMMPRKKLEYYAKQNGIEDFAKIKLTEEDCEKICSIVGCARYGLKDCGGSVSMLIDRVMDDKTFRAAHTNPDLPEDYNCSRYPDHAAMAVFKALATVRGA